MHKYINTTCGREYEAVYSRFWFGKRLYKAQKNKKKNIKEKKKKHLKPI